MGAAERIVTEGTRNKAYIRKVFAEDLKRRDREALARLRAEIRRAQLQKKAAMAAAVALCRAGRVAYRARAKQLRVEAAEATRRAIAAAKAEARQECERCKAEAREAGLSDVKRAERELHAERTLQRQIRAAEGRIRRQDKPRSSAKERRQESDDAVRSNIPRELVVVFDAVKQHIKEAPRRTRTEAFLEWVEAHPEEVVRHQQADADEYLRDLLEQERKHARAMKRPGRYRASAEQLARDLADVPF